jgi:hypothetical protein
MTLIARISVKSGKAVRTVALRKGMNVLSVDADASVTVIDEATGKVVEGAHFVRNGSEVSVTVPDSYFSASGDALGDAGSAAGASTAGAAGSADAALPPPGSGSGGGAAGGGSGGGDGGLIYGVLGGLAVAGGAVAASGGGGGGNGNKTPTDTTAPSAPTGLALAAADDHGSSNSDLITNLTSGLTINGSAEANATVTLREGTTVLGSGTANSSGAFSIDIALGQGAHSITATATDAAGNASSASSALAITVDTTAPTVAITSSTATLLGSDTATLTFTFSEAPTGFTAADITVSGGSISNFVATADPKVYTAELTPVGSQAGNIAVSVAGGTFADVAGNASTAPASLDITFDPGSNGQAIDGYIANAFVFRDSDGDGAWDHENFTDANNNGLFDAGEAYEDANHDGHFTSEYFTTTDAQGNFTNLFGTGGIVLTSLVAGDGTVLTTDISTGKAFAGQLTAPEGATIVTPLTTLVAALAGAGASADGIAAAQAQVKAALGLGSNVDLTTFDPIVAAGDSSASSDAIAVQKAAIQVANILSVMASASEAAQVSGGAQTAINAVVSVIAGEIGSNGSVNLSDPVLMSHIVQAVADAGGSQGATDAIAAQSAALASSLASVNDAVAQATGGDAVATLTAIVSAQIVAQQTLASEVSIAIETTRGGNVTILDSNNYQGAALDAKVSDAATHVEVILPTLGAPNAPVVDAGALASAAELADDVVVTVSYSAGTGVAAGDSLRLLVGGTEVRTVVLSPGDIPAVGGTGHIEFTLSGADLGIDGVKAISAGFVRADGALGVRSVPTTLTLDTAAPGAPAGLALASADDTGTSSVDHLTSQTSGLTITGAAEANATVTLRDGATIVGTGTADGSGSFSIDIALGQGTHSITAIAADAAGNASVASAALSITVDGSAPAAPTALALAAADDSGASNTDRITNQTSGLTITGAAEANAIVTLREGATVLGTGTADGAGTFTIDLALGQGAHSITATVTDAAGNASAASAALSITVDASAPAVPTALTLATADDSGTSSSDRLTNQTSGLTITGMAEANATVTLREGATVIGTGTSDGAGNFSIDVALGQGVHSITATATDMAGNASAASTALSIAVDTSAPTAPTALVLAVADDSGSSNSDRITSQTSGLTISGTAEANATVTLREGATVLAVGMADGSGHFSMDIALGQGAHSITATAMDAAGNTSAASAELSIMVDASAPVAPTALGLAAADDSGTSNADRLTNQTSGLTITGTAEANASVTLRDGGTVIGTGTADGSGSFSVDVALAQGAHSITATATDAAGNASATSTALSITVDTSAPLVPTSLALAAGPVVNSAEAANGVLLTGTADVGSTVSVTFTNGAQTLVKQAVVIGTFFNVALSSEEVAQLGEGDVSYSAVATDTAGNASSPSVVSHYFFTDDRIDGGISNFQANDGSRANVTPLAGGGFAVHWTVDADRDGTGDRIAVQRFAADGSKQGDVILLQGVAPELLNHANTDPSIDFRALDNGGYALIYSLPLESSQGFPQTLNATNPFTASAGRPTYIEINSAPSGVEFRLSGLAADGTPMTIPVTVEDGIITVTQAMLDQFGFEDRLNVQAVGLTTGQTVSAVVHTVEDVRYDVGSALHTVASQQIVPATGTGVIYSAIGRPEVFHVNSASYANGSPTFVVMQITPAKGGFGIDLSGTGATLQPNGVIQIFNPVPNAQGDYVVPQHILDQLGDHDAQAILILGGLTVGSTLNGTISLHDPIGIPDGVFIQTFDADGMAVTSSGLRLDDDGSAFLNNEKIDVHVTPLSGGGFATSWVIDANRDGDGDGIAVQRFAADGSKDGNVVLLQGFAPELLSQVGDNGAIDLQALDDGGYALAFSMISGESSHSGTVSYNAAQPSQTIPFTGRLEQIVINNAPGNVSFALQGLSSTGVTTLVPVTVVDGKIQLTQAIFDQFGFDNRLSLMVNGLTSGQSVTATGTVLEDVVYDPAAPLVDLHVTRDVVNNLAVLFTPVGRPEAFHVDSVTYANGSPTFVLMTITPTKGSAMIDLAGIAGASKLPNGSIQLVFQANPAGDYVVPQKILDQVGDDDFQAVLVLGGASSPTITGTIRYHEPIPVPDGIFVQTFGADGVATSGGVRVDDIANPHVQNDETNALGMTPLANGGFVANWVVDDNHDGNGDGIAVQRFAADGSKVGGIVRLQGPAQEMGAIADSHSYDVKALDNGGYALSYTLEREINGRSFTLNNQFTNTTIVGRPTEIFVGTPPGNVTLAISGTGNDGLQKVVPVTPVDGVIHVTQDILDQFGFDTRLMLQASGFTAGQTVGGSVQVEEVAHYDVGGPLGEFHSSFVVLPNGTGIIYATPAAGRPETFHIDTSSNAPAQVLMQITPTTGDINTAGMSNVVTLPNGIIQISNMQPDAQGNYKVPDAILAQLGDHDAQILLILPGLAPGSTLTGTVGVHEPHIAVDGVFVQTFDSNGVALSHHMELNGSGASDLLLGDVGDDLLSGGGGNDVLSGGAGHDVLTGGAGADLFVLDAPGGQRLSAADLITDFQAGTDHLQLSGGLQFADLLIVQGNPATNGADASDALIIHGASGDILARLANADAATVTQASFM